MSDISTTPAPVADLGTPVGAPLAPTVTLPSPVASAPPWPAPVVRPVRSDGTALSDALASAAEAAKALEGSAKQALPLAKELTPKLPSPTDKAAVVAYITALIGLLGAVLGVFHVAIPGAVEREVASIGGTVTFGVAMLLSHFTQRSAHKAVAVEVAKKAA